MDKIRVRVPYRKYAVHRGYIDINESHAADEFERKLADKVWRRAVELHGFDRAKRLWRDTNRPLPDAYYEDEPANG